MALLSAIVSVNVPTRSLVPSAISTPTLDVIYGPVDAPFPTRAILAAKTGKLDNAKRIAVTDFWYFILYSFCFYFPNVY
jgi:hypothetical protein